MSVHAWCRDNPRDEAVRAAEDNRTGPLPTLADVIARPFAAAAKCSPAVSVSGEGQSGLRTERVTLEVTHCGVAAASNWLWYNAMAEFCPTKAWQIKSVRVVDGDITDGEIRLRADRDAAIRERDELRKEGERRLTMCERMKEERDQARFHAAIVQARVAELESAPAASGAAGTDVAEIARLAFDAGWGSSRDGFNAECAFDHLAPKESTFEGKGGEQYEKLKRESVAKIMSEAASGAAVLGWLTAEERLAVSGAILILDQHGPTNIGHSLNDILARSSPPEVVLPGDCGGESYDSFVAGWNNYRDEALKALAVAGVTVKEVAK